MKTFADDPPARILQLQTLNLREKAAPPGRQVPAANNDDRAGPESAVLRSVLRRRCPGVDPGFNVVYLRRR